MNVLVTGSSGLIGSALVRHLESEGHHVTRLARQARESDNSPTWDPASGRIDLSVGGPWDAVVHLAGENIAGGRWTKARKLKIRKSRVDGTKLLCDALANLDVKPTVVACASAIGFYGECGDVEVDEQQSVGTGFLAEVCQAWEGAAQPASDVGIRVVNFRLGVVLSTGGGALAKMLTPFRLGLGGVVGSGQQCMSWICLADAVRAIAHILSDDSMSGAVNVVAPNPVTNRTFTKTLGCALRRPTVVPMPAFVAKLAFGELAEALLLSSARVSPKQLMASGFSFEHDELADAFESVLR
ncbi:MAG: TIGR01777 family protein [Planctomycetes bacterium]|nr:TIGR01777 family protein [Planctomycetota bacterium]